MEPLHKEPIIGFVPVHVSSRHDGWTAERQIAFIEALAETAKTRSSVRTLETFAGTASASELAG